jgi:hypothetical protein
MSRNNRVCLTLLVCVIVTAFFLAAAPAPSYQGIPVDESVTLVAAHFQSSSGRNLLALPTPP